MPDFLSYPFEKYALDVSRETREKFSRYAELLLKWQKAINLVGPTTLESLAERHFLDSAQLVKYIPSLDIRLADMGSGAGFPGMILAMLGVRDVHLIESDVRKATFLREVSRETDTPVYIHDDRVEVVSLPDVDCVTARALAPLRDLLSFSSHLSTPGHPVVCLFLKGEKAEDEVKKAQKRWNFSLAVHQSVTEEGGKILEIRDLSKSFT